MTTAAADFRCFQIDVQFSGIERIEGNSIVARLSASGKPQRILFDIVANFERGTQESREPISAMVDCRVTYNGRTDITRRELTIPAGKPSANEIFGLHEPSLNKDNVDMQPIPLSVEMYFGNRRLAINEYILSFRQPED
jgi:hypothetical protein